MNWKHFTIHGRLLQMVVFTFLTTLWHVGRAEAQSSKTAAAIKGTVSDSSGAAMPGVEVRLRNAANNQTRIVITDGQGEFDAEELAVGTYEVKVQRAGFVSYLHNGVELALGKTAYLSIVLAPASASSSITVSAQPSAIDPAQTSVVSSVDTERIEELPVRSRNYLDFVLLAPGVSSAPGTVTGGHTALAGSGFTFGGLRARSNSISIDGLDNNDEFTGSSRIELSPEIVQEFQVVNNGLSAESGGASGGSINVITRSGTNTIHGDAFIFVQDSALNARDPFETDSGKPEFRRYRAGFALGGPILKNKTFYYLAAEQEHNRGQSGSDIDPGVASAVNGLFASGAFPGIATRNINTGFFPIARAETEAAGKLDHQLTKRTSVMLRYAFTNNRETGDAFNAGGIVDASASGSIFTSDNALSGSLTSVYGSEAIGDFRFESASRHAVLRSRDLVGPEIDIAGLISFGRPYGGLNEHRENHYQETYTYTRTWKKHLWKAGGTANRIHLHGNVPDGFAGVYFFDTLADFVAGRPDQFRQAFGNPRVDFPVTSFGGFLQDHWSFAPHFTLDFGGRYDFERLPAGFNQDTNNVSPRIGLAWSPTSQWVFRAGYGIFFDRYPLANITRAIEKNGARAFEQVADGNAAVSLFTAAGGGTLAAPASGIAPSIFRPDPRLATPYSEQTSAGAEYLLSKNLTVRADYMFVHGAKLSRTRNINLLPPVVLTPSNAASLGIPNPTPQQIGREVFTPGRVDPQFQDIYQLEDSASSHYHGASFTLNRRMENELEFSASYSISKAYDDASDFDEQPQNPFDLRAQHSLSRQQQQQRFVFNALWDLPIGEEEENGTASEESSSWLTRTFEHIEVAPIFTAESGRPVNPIVGVDANRAHAFPLSSRPLGFGRNSLAEPGRATMDFRVLKFFPFKESAHLDIVAEFFNLFNRANVAQINSVFGSQEVPLAGFAKPIEGAGARQIQFSLDLEF